MKKAVFIIPYFGEFPEWFQLFLNSCGQNPNYDWLILTDNQTKYDYPMNVRVVFTTFSELSCKIQQKFEFNIRLEKPYKLCDLKPMYGYLFQDQIKEYPFWGHCDIDTIFGKLDHFVSTSDYKKYDKIGVLGHLTLYRNTNNVNALFMKPLDGKLRYKEVLQTSENCSFDEEYNNSINTIFEAYKRPIKYDLKIANTYTKTSNFRLTTLDKNWNYHIEPTTQNLFVWDEGILNRYTKNKIKKQVTLDEYMYIHFQSRKMNVKIHNYKKYKIIPNVFEDLETQVVSYSNFPKSKHFNLHYLRLRSYNLYDKTKKKIMRKFK